MLVFEERGKPEYWEKNVWDQRREPTTNSTHIWRRRRDLNPGNIGGRQALSPLRHSLLPFLNVTENPSLFIFLMINNYISFVEKTNLIKSLLSSSCQLLSQRFISPVPNWRNIVGQWMLHVTSICTPCCLLLRTRVVGTGVFAQASSFQLLKLETLLRWSFFTFNVGSVCTAFPTFLRPRTRIRHSLQGLMGCILPTMHWRSQHC